jgi:hypothetical protein
LEKALAHDRMPSSTLRRISCAIATIERRVTFERRLPDHARSNTSPSENGARKSTTLTRALPLVLKFKKDIEKKTKAGRQGPMSGVGTSETLRPRQRMSPFAGRADIPPRLRKAEFDGEEKWLLISADRSWPVRVGLFRC